MPSGKRSVINGKHVFGWADLVGDARSATLRVHTGVIQRRWLSALSADANAGVCRLPNPGPLVERTALDRRTHGAVIAGSDRDDQIGFLTVHHQLEASPFRQRSFYGVPRRGIGDRKSTRLNSVTFLYLVCRLLLEK